VPGPGWGDPVAVALERYEVVVIELACLQPLDRAEEQHLPRDWFRPAPA
jgi:hypothetical protein